jgi:hypothetical protein
VSDLHADLASTLAELAPGANDDEEDLERELAEMVQACGTPAAPAPTAEVVAPVPAVSAAVLGLLPKVPTHAKSLPGVAVPKGSVLLGAAGVPHAT